MANRTYQNTYSKEEIREALQVLRAHEGSWIGVSLLLRVTSKTIRNWWDKGFPGASEEQLVMQHARRLRNRANKVASKDVEQVG